MNPKKELPWGLWVNPKPCSHKFRSLDPNLKAVDVKIPKP